MSRLTTMAGFTLLELLVVIGMVGIISGIVSYQLKDLDNPAANGAAQVMTFIKKTRAKALATTYAYRLQPTADGTGLETEYAGSCNSTTFTPDNNLLLELPNTAAFTSNTWSLCFAPRGTSTSSEDITITDPRSSVTIQVAMGGGMRKLP